MPQSNIEMERSSTTASPSTKRLAHAFQTYEGELPTQKDPIGKTILILWMLSQHLLGFELDLACTDYPEHGVKQLLFTRQERHVVRVVRISPHNAPPTPVSTVSSLTFTEVFATDEQIDEAMENARRNRDFKRFASDWDD